MPEAPSFLVRTGWFYLGVLVVFSWIGFAIREPLLEGLTTLALMKSLALTVLVSVWPVRTMAALRSCSLPWWWNALGFGVFGMFLLGTIIDSPFLMFVGFVTFTAVCAVITIGVWAVEARHSVRVYSGPNSVVFVKRDEAA